MSKRVQQNLDESSSVELTPDPVNPKSPVARSGFVWSPTARRAATAAILVYLAILLLGPLSTPVAPRHLIGPLAAQISPVHRILFQGHGYRFFAPDPGPSHRLVYQGIRADGTEFSGHFPDRENDWPRLLYHRWFMLSERVFLEYTLQQPEQQFQAICQQYDQEILSFQNQGKLELSHQLILERDLGIELYQSNRVRFERLVESIANVLLERNQGNQIELFVQERVLPFPEQVIHGAQIDGEEFLSSPTKIGELDSDGFRATPIDPPPEPGKIPAPGDAP